jgi:hypothetical protein
MKENYNQQFMSHACIKALETGGRADHVLPLASGTGIVITD